MLTKKTCHCHRQKYHIWQLVACHWHILKTTVAPRIESWGTPQDTDAGWQKLFAKLIKNDLLDKYDLICWSFTYCLSWTLGSSSKCIQLSDNLIRKMLKYKHLTMVNISLNRIIFNMYLNLYYTRFHPYSTSSDLLNAWRKLGSKTKNFIYISAFFSNKTHIDVIIDKSLNKWRK